MRATARRRRRSGVRRACSREGQTSQPSQRIEQTRALGSWTSWKAERCARQVIRPMLDGRIRTTACERSGDP